MTKDILLKVKREIVLHTEDARRWQPPWISTQDVFYYTEALVLFCNANVNIFFSCIYNVCADAWVYACMSDCVCGLDCVGALGLFKSPCIISPPIPFLWSRPPPKTLPERTQELKQGCRVLQWMYWNTLTLLAGGSPLRACFLHGCAVSGEACLQLKAALKL